MQSKRKLSHQIEIFNSIGDQLNQRHPLYILANKINWQLFDDSFSSLFCADNGRPAKPIRLMVSLILLKHLRNVSDESIVEQWGENMYYQYFSGEVKFVCNPPCVPSELVMFRHRIGEKGIELIFKESIRVNDDETPIDKNNFVVSIDTTIQEKNITYPTDDKLYKKVIKKCWKIAINESVALRQSYTATIKKLSVIQRFKNNKNGRKAARKANKRIHTIAFILVRELKRKLDAERLEVHIGQLNFFTSLLQQKRTDKQKIYSIHEPHTKCFTKGKAHQKFEFGSKVSIAVSQDTGIIVAACNISENIHDSKTVAQTLEQCERLTKIQPKEAFVDRGYVGIKTYKECIVQIPKPDKNITKEKRKKHSNRAAIEPIIGHLKTSYRLCRNFYKGIFGDNINILLAAAAMNFKRVMNLWSTGAILRWLLTFKNQFAFLGKLISMNQKLGF
jgi:transposase, IS5 family